MPQGGPCGLASCTLPPGNPGRRRERLHLQPDPESGKPRAVGWVGSAAAATGRWRRTMAVIATQLRHPRQNVVPVDRLGQARDAQLRAQRRAITKRGDAEHGNPSQHRIIELFAPKPIPSSSGIIRSRRITAGQQARPTSNPTQPFSAGKGA